MMKRFSDPGVVVMRGRQTDLPGWGTTNISR